MIRPIAQDMVLFRQLQDDGVLLDMRAEEYFGFDSVATKIWLTLMSTTCLSEAVDQLLVEFEVERSVLEDDIAELLNDLERRNIISLAPSTNGHLA